MGRRGVGHRHGRPRRRLQRQRGSPAQHKVPPARPSAAPPARAARRSCRVWRAHRLIWVESPANPTWGVTDIPAMADLAQEAGALLAVDSTAATPALSQPLTLGADLVMHSATKCSVPACATPRRCAPRAPPVRPQQAERHPATAAATAAATATATAAVTAAVTAVAGTSTGTRTSWAARSWRPPRPRPRPRGHASRSIAAGQAQPLAPLTPGCFRRALPPPARPARPPLSGERRGAAPGAARDADALPARRAPERLGPRHRAPLREPPPHTRLSRARPAPAPHPRATAAAPGAPNAARGRR
jgi:hypothetical protein